MVDDFQDESTTKSEILDEIKKSSGKCAILLLILGVLAQGVSFLAGAILIIFSKMSNNYLYFTNSEVINIVLSIIPCILVDVLVIKVGLKLYNLNLKTDIFKKTEYKKDIVLLGTVSIGGVLLISTSIYLCYSTILQALGITIPSPDFTFPSSVPMQVIYISYVCIFGPLFEEIIFRGIILNGIKQFGKLTAIIFTSIIFSMFHLNLVQFITPLLLGMLLAFVTVKTESIFPAIIMHMFNNTMATVVTFISGKSQIIASIISAIIILSGVIGLIFFINKYKDDFMFLVKEDSEILSFKKKLKYCFRSSWSIGYIFFYVVFIVINFIFFNI